jgi:hypothetical protein
VTRSNALIANIDEDSSLDAKSDEIGFMTEEVISSDPNSFEEAWIIKDPVKKGKWREAIQRRFKA